MRKHKERNAKIVMARSVTDIENISSRDNIGLACDFTGFPNLAMMKIATYAKKRGAKAEIFDPAKQYSLVVASKVFSFTEELEGLPEDTIKGGTGWKKTNWLPDYIEHICPDYDLYEVTRGRKRKTGPMDFSLGFLTRGCSRKCSFCVVPEKEGPITAHADVEEFLRHDKVVLMDNNILAEKSGHGVKQIEKLARLGVAVDFNQGLDARLIGEAEARLLGKLKWIDGPRMACDHISQMPSVQRSMELFRLHNVAASKASAYVLIDDEEDALERLHFLKRIGVRPYAQILRDEKNTPPRVKQMKLQRWANALSGGVFKTHTFEAFCQRPDVKNTGKRIARDFT